MKQFDCPEISAGCYALTLEQAQTLFTPEQLAAGEARFQTKHFGPWQIVTSITAIAGRHEFTNGAPLTVYGYRTASNPKESGFAMEGTVSISGKKHRVFTTDTMFQLPDGTLFKAAMLFVCEERGKK